MERVGAQVQPADPEDVLIFLVERSMTFSDAYQATHCFPLKKRLRLLPQLVGSDEDPVDPVCCLGESLGSFPVSHRRIGRQGAVLT